MDRVVIELEQESLEHTVKHCSVKHCTIFNKTSYSASAVKLTILQAVILILHLLILLFRPILECMIVDDNALVRGIDSFELLQS